MELRLACNRILDQMGNVIEQIPEHKFSIPSTALNGSTLGQHFRHSIEFFECLSKGVQSGVVNYDNREHDTAIETSKVLSLEVISRIKNFIKNIDLSQQVQLNVSYDSKGNEGISVESNIAREVIYNIEHAVHHMALVKIGLKDVCPAVSIPEDFGVAISTIKYQRTQA